MSAFNPTERVRKVFEDVAAESKYWLVHSEYGFGQADLPIGSNVYSPMTSLREDDFVRGFVEQHPELSTSRLCVDISGFMRPHLMFLVRLLSAMNVRSFDALYSEPGQYVERERTEFSLGSVSDVRPIAGFEGAHEPARVHQPTIGSDGREEDVLIIGAGYEHDLMRRVANHKTHARKLQVLGFPPLQADFYQENVLNAHRAAEAVKADNDMDPLLTPACDPFVTASVVSDAIVKERKRGARNIYLCPLASRPQALGFALLYLFELRDEPVSIIYPFSSRYARETSSGIARIWKYRIELP